MSNGDEDDSDLDINEIRSINDKNIAKIQMDTIKKIINMFPKILEKHKIDIVNSIVGNTIGEKVCTLTKIIIDDNVYYRYSKNSIFLDNKCNICGTYYKIKNNYIYYPFKNTIKRNKEYKNLLNKLDI